MRTNTQFPQFPQKIVCALSAKYHKITDFSLLHDFSANWSEFCVHRFSVTYVSRRKKTQKLYRRTLAYYFKFPHAVSSRILGDDDHNRYLNPLINRNFK